MRMAVAIFSSMNIMMIDIAKYAGFFSGIERETLKLIHIAELYFHSRFTIQWLDIL